MLPPRLSRQHVLNLMRLMRSRPADDGHPYGHEKLEILAAGVVGLSLLGMAYDVLTSAIGRITDPGSLPTLDGMAFVVLGLTLFVNVFVAAYEKRQGQQLNSQFLLSDAVHTRSDVLVTFGVLVTTVLVRIGYPALDAFAALGIAMFIAWAGISVLRSNLGYLADARAIDIGVVDPRAPGRYLLGVECDGRTYHSGATARDREPAVHAPQVRQPGGIEFGDRRRAAPAIDQIVPEFGDRVSQRRQCAQPCHDYPFLFHRGLLI